MAALDITTQIPPAIDSLEKIIAWGVLTGNNLFGTQTYQEIQNNFLEREIDVSIVRAADGTIRLIFRGGIKLDPTYATATNQKLWTFAQPWGDASIPTAYQTD